MRALIIVLAVAAAVSGQRGPRPRLNPGGPPIQVHPAGGPPPYQGGAYGPGPLVYAAPMPHPGPQAYPPAPRPAPVHAYPPAPRPVPNQPHSPAPRPAPVPQIYHDGQQDDGRYERWDPRSEADRQRDWNQAFANWQDEQKRIRNTNRQYYRAANAQWNTAYNVQVGSSHPPPPAIPTGNPNPRPGPDGDGHDGNRPSARPQHIPAPDQHPVSPWRNAPADPSTLWSCNVNPAACSKDINWLARGLTNPSSASQEASVENTSAARSSEEQ